MAAGLPSTCTQQVETLLVCRAQRYGSSLLPAPIVGQLSGVQVALKSVLPDCGKEGSLLRHVLQSTACADTTQQHIGPKQFKAACEECSKVSGRHCAVAGKITMPQNKAITCNSDVCLSGDRCTDGKFKDKQQQRS